MLGEAGGGGGGGEGTGWGFDRVVRGRGVARVVVRRVRRMMKRGGRRDWEERDFMLGGEVWVDVKWKMELSVGEGYLDESLGMGGIEVKVVNGGSGGINEGWELALKYAQ